MKARINVTKKDIEQGLENKERCCRLEIVSWADSCPVALALQRRGLEDVRVEEEVMVLPDGHYPLGYPIKLSERTQKFIEDFDDDMDMRPVELKPFSFTISDRWLRKDSNGKLYFD